MPHVLIVEDDPQMREFFGSLLRHHGYTTDTACDGREALDCAERRRPCLVLLDLIMPVMNGWEFRAKQLETPELADVPVVCVTGSPDACQAGEVLGARCLPKPVNCDEVMEAVREACGKRAITIPTGLLRPYDAWRGVETLGDVFVMSRSDRKARCELRTHPLGWEVRLVATVRDDFALTEVCRTEREISATAAKWKAKLLLKGWK